ncbi:hypothetical protein I6A60_08580 [Frankia sp. AgB1.9]|uniref:hypothetical protein n=1 Tax=unclassified Frankia TaxID=2632575 RepID=UPI001934A78D|nr:MULTISPECIES: hypothetical protein [unclassified Frankia]MBL7487182.1 hypothetical protein [Frankia sp. AgW1.1]MBL7547927.1 hypothetical protein [Frankia sp. AgB1.9]MBL7623949.1 hypothetical protein [Frankia sp. AgB1.8]
MSGGGGDRRAKNIFQTCIALIFGLMVAQSVIQELMPLLPFAVGGAVAAAVIYYFVRRRSGL